ncbi:hypothetical protein O9G_000522 [Rozella allomycis CSF55]|uniref:Uncharacterized protein n=1 Tax=Rozella allomycis (strain CSF55) TaxID=988480 RepID=A0A075AW06_ROZAC|nr:hypothetical protein O9G_000522 [Rozella allomycis CSF55]|eukprot:EPZ34335.1 hypothetical protein O9G_000522 [Rozella allomycis CSF55]
MNANNLIDNLVFSLRGTKRNIIEFINNKEIDEIFPEDIDKMIKAFYKRCDTLSLLEAVLERQVRQLNDLYTSEMQFSISIKETVLMEGNIEGESISNVSEVYHSLHSQTKQLALSCESFSRYLSSIRSVADDMRLTIDKVISLRNDVRQDKSFGLFQSLSRSGKNITNDNYTKAIEDLREKLEFTLRTNDAELEKELICYLGQLRIYFGNSLKCVRKNRYK